MRLLVSSAMALAIVAAASQATRPADAAQRVSSDLDALMRQVLSTRDENWKKLQQYVLDEREAMEVRGPSQRPIWGEHREYTWYSGTDRRRGRTTSDEDRAYDQEFRRLMNKVALVTLWVEPNAHQIVKYTFNNVALDFLPVQWLMHVDEVTASMNMGQPFPDVWLPRDVQIDAAISVVSGQFYLHYGLEYHDYRQADVTSKIKIP